MSKQILVNSSHYETRVATLENGEIRQLHIEREEDKNVVGNIYLGVVKRVLPGMQAAFLELGLERTAFLYVDDIIEQPFGGDVEVLDTTDDGDGDGEPSLEVIDETEDGDAIEVASGPDDVTEEEIERLSQEENKFLLKAPALDINEGEDSEEDESDDLDDDEEEDFERPDIGFDVREEEGPEATAPEAAAPVQSKKPADNSPELVAKVDKSPEVNSVTIEATEVQVVTTVEAKQNPRQESDIPHEDNIGNVRPAGEGREPRDPQAPRSRDNHDRGPRPQRGRDENRNFRERTPRNRNSRDNRDRQGPRDQGPREQGPRDRDQNYRDQGPREQGPRDRDQNYRDQGPREQGPRDRDQNYRDQGPREQGPRDRDQNYRDQGPREQGPRDRDQNYRDQGPREQGPRDRDQNYRDQGPREQGQRDNNGPREQGPRRDNRNARGGGGGGGERDNFRGRRDSRGGFRSGGRGGNYPRRGSKQRFSKRRPRGSAKIEDLLKEGQEILVQVAKAPIGTKGARLTTHISLPGRNLVLMPTVKHIGISRRIENDRERRRLRDIFTKKLRPRNVGFIIRTVADGKSFRDLKADADYLVKTWAKVQRLSKTKSAPALIHEDLSLSMRAVRDFFTEEVDSLVIDNPEEHDDVTKFIGQFMPRLKSRVKLFKGPTQLFEHYGIEAEISRALGKKVWLKSGGYLLVDQSEALTAIDVNTGRYVGTKSLEETILKTNLEAVKEIAYQLRIRNVGGIIIIDLIDMENYDNRDKVYQALQEALSEDKSKTNILKISELGLVEMTRKRTHEDLVRYLTEACTYCDGRGYHKSRRTVCFEIFREIEKEALGDQKNIVVFAAKDVVTRMMTEEKKHVEQLEKRFEKIITVKADPNFHMEQFEVFGKH